MKKYLTEALGTLILSTLVIASLAAGGDFPTAIYAGLTLAILVVTLGPISGTHINPAVTVGLWSLKKISAASAVGYLLAQFIGAGLARVLAFYMELNLPIFYSDFSPLTLLAEALGAAIFTFGIASVVLGKNDPKHAPLVIGGSLAIGALTAGGFGSNGVLNPAVAFAISSFGPSYLVGPVIGSVVGMWLAKKLV